jgi:hypothetical protein
MHPIGSVFLSLLGVERGGGGGVLRFLGFVVLNMFTSSSQVVPNEFLTF